VCKHDTSHFTEGFGETPGRRIALEREAVKRALRPFTQTEGAERPLAGAPAVTPARAPGGRPDEGRPDEERPGRPRGRAPLALD
jgi:hypothetical protein